MPGIMPSQNAMKGAELLPASSLIGRTLSYQGIAMTCSDSFTSGLDRESLRYFSPPYQHEGCPDAGMSEPAAFTTAASARGNPAAPLPHMSWYQLFSNQPAAIG